MVETVACCSLLANLLLRFSWCLGSPGAQKASSQSISERGCLAGGRGGVEVAGGAGAGAGGVSLPFFLLFFLPFVATDSVTFSTTTVVVGEGEGVGVKKSIRKSLNSPDVTVTPPNLPTYAFTNRPNGSSPTNPSNRRSNAKPFSYGTLLNASSGSASAKGHKRRVKPDPSHPPSSMRTTSSFRCCHPICAERSSSSGLLTRETILRSSHTVHP